MKPNVVSTTNVGAVVVIAVGAIVFAYFMINGMSNADVGFSSYDTYPININDVNVIDVKLNNTDDYTLNFDKVFYVNKGSEPVCELTFLRTEQYEKYVNYANNSNLTTLIEKKLEDKQEFVFYRDMLGGDPSFKYVIKLKNFEYLPMITSYISAEQATECFERMAFVIK